MLLVFCLNTNDEEICWAASAETIIITHKHWWFRTTMISWLTQTVLSVECPQCVAPWCCLCWSECWCWLVWHLSTLSTWATLESVLITVPHSSPSSARNTNTFIINSTSIIISAVRHVKHVDWVRRHVCRRRSGPGVRWDMIWPYETWHFMVSETLVLTMWPHPMSVNIVSDQSETVKYGQTWLQNSFRLEWVSGGYFLTTHCLLLVRIQCYKSSYHFLFFAETWVSWEVCCAINISCFSFVWFITSYIVSKWTRTKTKMRRIKS